MSLTSHLIAHRILTFDNYLNVDTAVGLYHEMTETAQFNSSKVSDHRGDVHAKVDTDYQEISHDGRISETAYDYSYSEIAKDELKRINKDVCDMLGVSTRQMEPWQCTRYFTGGKFDYHDDCGNWASNERLYTVMITVKAPDHGGATHFINLGKTVESKSGRLIIWRNLDEDFLCNGESKHAGLPVGLPGTKDEKMILVTWIRRFDYVS